MTKLVFISDTHGRHRSLSHPLPNGDILIHCGDWSRGRFDNPEPFLEWFASQSAQYKVFTNGNHDGFAERFPDEMAKAVARHPSIHLLQDSDVTLCGLRIYGSAWTPTFLNWYWMKGRGAPIREKWDLIPDGIDVLVTHGPPMGYLDSAVDFVDGVSQIHVGCADLLDAIKRVQPRCSAHGHIHHHGGRFKELVHPDGSKTTIINASVVDGSYTPCHAPVVFHL